MITGVTQSPAGFSINKVPEKEQVPAWAAGSASALGDCTQLCPLPLPTAVTKVKQGYTKKVV